MAGKHKPQPGVRDTEGRKIPRKYLRGLSAKKQKQMKHEIKSFRDKPDDHKEAYKPWTADRGVTPKKKSKATKLYHRMFGEDVIYESSASGLAKKAAQSGIPLSILRQVFNRGMAAWKTGHRPGVAQQQWAYGRVNSFITGAGGARKADADLWAKAKRHTQQAEQVDMGNAKTMLQLEMMGFFRGLVSKQSRRDSSPTQGERNKSSLTSNLQKIRELEDLRKKIARRREENTARGRRIRDVLSRGRNEESVDLLRTALLAEDVCEGRPKNKPWRTPGGPKKFAVCADGKLVRFGDPNLEIKRDDPERRKNFRARHNCASPGPRTKAKYWACRTWERGKTVSDIVN